MLVDTHLHLDAEEFDDDREAVLTAARAAGIRHFILPAVATVHFGRVAALVSANADIHPAYGIHPLYIDKAHDGDLDQVDARLRESSTVAVGEIGLDHFVADLDRTRQEAFFVEQLHLARRYDLPVILHLRHAQDEILKHLRHIPVPGGIAHAFNGSQQQAEAFIKLGFKLGVGGAMTYEGSKRIRALAASLPLDTLVLETDAPDIPPAWARGQRNEPANLRQYAQLLAELRGITCEEVIEATGRNALAALPRLQA